MNTTYEAVRPLEDGKPVPVCERDESGALVGAWIGYWSFKRETVSLYPDVRNKYVNWPGGRVPRDKRIVSDRIIKCRMQNAEYKATPHPSAEPTPSPAGEGRGETWRDRKLPMQGQERMDI